MVKIDNVINTRYNTNSYIYKEHNKCIIIDCNINTYNYIINNNLIPEYLFLTHEHFDHIIGAGRLKKAFPQMMIIASTITSGLVQDSKGNMSFYLDGIGIEEVAADIFIENVSEFDFHGHKINTYYTPGHTTGGIIIHIDNMLFTGDTLLNIKTPTTLPNSSKQQLKESIEFIDKNFDDNTIFYQGHGEPFLKKDWDKNKSLGIKK